MTNPTETNPNPSASRKPRELTDQELEYIISLAQSPQFIGDLSQPEDLKDLVADMADSKPLRVLDAANLFSLAELRMLRRESPEPWQRVSFAWPGSPSEVLDTLEETPSFGPTLFVLDLLWPFLDARLPFEQRKRLLQACLVHLVRLHTYSFVVVSICLPETLDPETKELFRLLATMALKTHNLLVLSPRQE